MLGVFRRELPPLAETAIRPASCSVRPGRSGKAFRRGQLQLVYRVEIELGSDRQREYVLLGISPVSAGFPGTALEERCRRLRSHPAVAPFRELVLFLEHLQLGLFFFPVDPSLPGLAEITGTEGGRLLAPFLPECGAGSEIERIECELRHYKPFNRAVLRVRATLAGRGVSRSERAVYVKAFDDDRGDACYRELAALWSVAQRSRFLRVPEPLGYDPDRRLVVMGEAPGERHLTEWVRCLKKGQPLPAEVDQARMERCFFVVANALRELQGCGLRPETRCAFPDELAGLRKEYALLPDVEDGHPELLSRVETLLQRLESLAPEDEPLVPAHGEFRHQQLVGDERSLTLIDWDGFCLANPALDAARMLARLRRDFLKRPGGFPELERMAESFRREFLAAVPEAGAHLDLYEGLDLTKQVLDAFGSASRGEDTAAHIHLQATAAEALLDGVEG